MVPTSCVTDVRMITTYYCRVWGLGTDVVVVEGRIGTSVLHLLCFYCNGTVAHVSAAAVAVPAVQVHSIPFLLLLLLLLPLLRSHACIDASSNNAFVAPCYCCCCCCSIYRLILTF